MADLTLMQRAGNTFGFSSWNLNTGLLGNFIIWLMLSLLFVGVIGFIIGFIIWRRTYKHTIVIWGMVGNNPTEKEILKGKGVPIGNAGDRLMYVRGRKKLIPYPTLQTGNNKWLFWEREDGELINITINNVDTTMKQMNVKFIDTDMRMQRLGIEKNLQFRLQQQGFWAKYGQMIMNVIFYVLIMMILIVLFVQWRKTAESITKAVTVASEVMKYQCSGLPEGNSGEGSGVIPAIILLGIVNFKYIKNNLILK